MTKKPSKTSTEVGPPATTSCTDLTSRFGRGFGRRNLFQMRAFTSPIAEIVQTPSAQSPVRSGPEQVQTRSARFSGAIGSLVSRFPLPWSHYVRLLGLKTDLRWNAPTHPDPEHDSDRTGRPGGVHRHETGERGAVRVTRHDGRSQSRPALRFSDPDVEVSQTAWVVDGEHGEAVLVPVRGRVPRGPLVDAGWFRGRRDHGSPLRGRGAHEP